MQEDGSKSTLIIEIRSGRDHLGWSTALLAKTVPHPRCSVQLKGTEVMDSTTSLKAILHCFLHWVSEDNVGFKQNLKIIIF